MQLATGARPSFRSTAARPGPVGLIAEALREAIDRRRLMRHLVSADIKRKGGDTVLGNVWWILDPLLQMTVYLILMTVILRRSTPDFPLFLFAAILPFKWFTSTIGTAVNSVVRQERLIKQVAFPKIVLPVSANIAEILNFAVGAVILVLIMVVGYRDHLTLNVLWLPVIAFVQFVFTLGLSLIVSAVNVFYRDVGILMGHATRLWFFLSPTLWAFDTVAGRFDAIQEVLGPVGVTLLRWNPFAVLLTAYRDVTYGRVIGTESAMSYTPGQPPDLIALGVLLLLSIGLVLLGALVFKRVEPAFAKVL